MIAIPHVDQRNIRSIDNIIRVHEEVIKNKVITSQQRSQLLDISRKSLLTNNDNLYKINLIQELKSMYYNHR